MQHMCSTSEIVESAREVRIVAGEQMSVGRVKHASVLPPQPAHDLELGPASLDEPACVSVSEVVYGQGLEPSTPHCWHPYAAEVGLVQCVPLARREEERAIGCACQVEAQHFD